MYNRSQILKDDDDDDALLRLIPHCVRHTPISQSDPP